MILRLYDVDKWHERHAETNGDAMILRLYGKTRAPKLLHTKNKHIQITK